MKIRTGFVSNSSTSSFLIYGVCLDKYELEQALIPERSEEDDNFEDVEDDARSILEDMFKGKDIDIEYPAYYDSVFIGRSWGNIQDSQTGAEFKKEIETIIREALGEKIEIAFDTHQEAWHD